MGKMSGRYAIYQWQIGKGRRGGGFYWDLYMKTGSLIEAEDVRESLESEGRQTEIVDLLEEASERMAPYVG